MNSQPELHQEAKSAYAKAIRAAQGDPKKIELAQAAYRKALQKH